MTRAPKIVATEYIANSLNIGIDGQFAIWAGSLITDMSTPIIVLAEEGREKEAITRLARVGYDNTIGYLQGGIAAWKNAGKPTDTITSIIAEEFINKYKTINYKVLDVRKVTEYLDGHIPDAVNSPLDYLEQNYTKLNPEAPYYLHCKGGYRSMIAASFLKSKGFKTVVDVAGGFDAIQKLLPKEQIV